MASAGCGLQSTTDRRLLIALEEQLYIRTARWSIGREAHRRAAPADILVLDAECRYRGTSVLSCEFLETAQLRL